MLIGEILLQLREEIRTRIRKGELTERGLARRIGLSQTHVHHILKGVRLLTPEVADLLLADLDISVEELVAKVESAGSPKKGPGLETHARPAFPHKTA